MEWYHIFGLESVTQERVIILSTSGFAILSLSLWVDRIRLCIMIHGKISHQKSVFSILLILQDGYPPACLIWYFILSLPRPFPFFWLWTFNSISYLSLSPLFLYFDELFISFIHLTEFTSHPLLLPCSSFSCCFYFSLF